MTYISWVAVLRIVSWIPNEGKNTQILYVDFLWQGKSVSGIPA